MPFLTKDELHPVATKCGKRYLFTKKHHGGVGSQWHPDLTKEEEFSVFCVADENEIADSRKWLFGMLMTSGKLKCVGTQKQSVAGFPFTRGKQPWHGFPLYPLKEQGPKNRRGQQCRPEANVFKKLVKAGLLTPGQMGRLQKGQHIC